MTDSALRPLPALNDLNRPFWTGGAQGQLLIQRCRACGHYIHPPTPICPRCLSRDVAPGAVSGRGEVASFTINYQQWVPGLQTPYVIAIVELAEQEGLRLTTNIIHCAVEEVRIGMAVHVVFERREDVYLPLFEPADRTAVH